MSTLNLSGEIGEIIEWYVDIVAENNKLAAAACDSKISSRSLRTFWHVSCENREDKETHKKYIKSESVIRGGIVNQFKLEKNNNTKQWLWQCDSVFPAWKFTFLRRLCSHENAKIKNLGKWTPLCVSLSPLNFFTDEYKRDQKEKKKDDKKIKTLCLPRGCLWFATSAAFIQTCVAAVGHH